MISPKKKKMPLQQKIMIGVGIVIVIFVITVLSVKITHVEVTGNEYYTDEQMEALVLPTDLSHNSLYCFINTLLGKKEAIPFVQDYKISFISPVKVEIITYEKSIVGYVSYMSSYMYFDKDGIVVESTNRELDGIPLITGLKYGSIVLYQPLPVEDKDVFSEILNLTQVLYLYGIKVDKIKYTSAQEAALTIGDIEVELGNSQEMNGKIAELKDMLPQLEGLSGTLYLDTYDPTNSNLMYTFKKR